MQVTPHQQNPYRELREVPDSWWEERTKNTFNTYVWQHPFHEVHDGIEYHYYRDVDYDGLPSSKIDPKYPRFELVKISLTIPYVTPQVGEHGNTQVRPISPLWDSYSDYFLDMLGVINQGRPEKKLDYYFFSNIILPKNIAEEIRSMIKDFDLVLFEDFMFFLIAKIQNEFVREVEYYQTKEQQEKIKKFPQECVDLVKVVEKNYERYRVSPDYKSGKQTWSYYDEENKKYIPHSKPSTLQKIVFHFDNEKPIAIRDELLLSNITDGIVHLRDRIFFSWQTGKRREWLDNENYLRWKAHILSLPELLYTNHRKNQFKDSIAEALYKFLTTEAKLQVSQSHEVIARIFDFAWIEVKKRQHSDLPADTETIRKRIARKRKKK
jgi:hypothetical protein